MVRPILPLVALAIFAAVPARADEVADVYQATPCSFACKLWRNVSGRVQVSVPSPVTADAFETSHEPTPEDEARRPDVNRLVVVHGDILKKSAAERARERAALALQEKRFDAMQKEQASAGLKPKGPSETRQAN